MPQSTQLYWTIKKYSYQCIILITTYTHPYVLSFFFLVLDCILFDLNILYISLHIFLLCTESLPEWALTLPLPYKFLNNS